MGINNVKRILALTNKLNIQIMLEYQKYRVAPGGGFRLASVDPSENQGLDEATCRRLLKENRKRIAKLQERLYAEGKHSVLLVLQAMDAGGKDSTIKAVTKGVNPQGCRVASFKAPSKEELAHDFLWRVHAKAPRKGYIRIFNRSHYEDVLIVRVHGWATPEQTEQRYGHINDFERLLHDHHTHIAKVMLHISPAYQLEQFRERLEDPGKQWKFNPGDLEERKLWPAYMDAFETALNRCSPDHAPWYVVPAEHKWFRCLTVSQILLDLLERINPQYPAPDYDAAVYTPESLADHVLEV